MSAVGAARLLTAGAAWRVAGLGSAGRALVAALGRDDETERTVAGIMLVRAGDRSVPLLADALLAGGSPDDLVGPLTSIGTPAARNALRTVAVSTEPTVGPPAREAAAQALRTLAEIDRLDRP